MITDLKINEEKKKEYYEKGYWTHDTIRDVWERQAQANADKEYVADDQGCRMTYGEVDDAASRLAAWLVSQGIKPGDVVTLQFPNWAEFKKKMINSDGLLRMKKMLLKESNPENITRQS